LVGNLIDFFFLDKSCCVKFKLIVFKFQLIVFFGMCLQTVVKRILVKTFVLSN